MSVSPTVKSGTIVRSPGEQSVGLHGTNNTNHSSVFDNGAVIVPHCINGTSSNMKMNSNSKSSHIINTIPRRGLVKVEIKVPSRKSREPDWSPVLSEAQERNEKISKMVHSQVSTTKTFNFTLRKGHEGTFTVPCKIERGIERVFVKFLYKNKEKEDWYPSEWIQNELYRPGHALKKPTSALACKYFGPNICTFSFAGECKCTPKKLKGPNAMLHSNIEQLDQAIVKLKEHSEKVNFVSRPLSEIIEKSETGVCWSVFRKVPCTRLGCNFRHVSYNIAIWEEVESRVKDGSIDRHNYRKIIYEYLLEQYETIIFTMDTYDSSLRFGKKSARPHWEPIISGLRKRSLTDLDNFEMMRFYFFLRGITRNSQIYTYRFSVFPNDPLEEEVLSLFLGSSKDQCPIAQESDVMEFTYIEGITHQDFLFQRRYMCTRIECHLGWHSCKRAFDISYYYCGVPRSLCNKDHIELTSLPAFKNKEASYKLKKEEREKTVHKFINAEIVFKNSSCQSDESVAAYTIRRNKEKLAVSELRGLIAILTDELTKLSWELKVEDQYATCLVRDLGYTYTPFHTTSVEVAPIEVSSFDVSVAFPESNSSVVAPCIPSVFRDSLLKFVPTKKRIFDDFLKRVKDRSPTSFKSIFKSVMNQIEQISTHNMKIYRSYRDPDAKINTERLKNMGNYFVMYKKKKEVRLRYIRRKKLIQERKKKHLISLQDLDVSVYFKENVLTQIRSRCEYQATNVLRRKTATEKLEVIRNRDLQNKIHTEHLEKIKEIEKEKFQIQETKSKFNEVMRILLSTRVKYGEEKRITRTKHRQTSENDSESGSDSDDDEDDDAPKKPTLEFKRVKGHWQTYIIGIKTKKRNSYLNQMMKKFGCTGHISTYTYSNNGRTVHAIILIGARRDTYVSRITDFLKDKSENINDEDDDDDIVVIPVPVPTQEPVQLPPKINRKQLAAEQYKASINRTRTIKQSKVVVVKSREEVERNIAEQRARVAEKKKMEEEELGKKNRSAQKGHVAPIKMKGNKRQCEVRQQVNDETDRLHEIYKEGRNAFKSSTMAKYDI